MPNTKWKTDYVLTHSAKNSKWGFNDGKRNGGRIAGQKKGYTDSDSGQVADVPSSYASKADVTQGKVGGKVGHWVNGQFVAGTSSKVAVEKRYAEEKSMSNYRRQKANRLEDKRKTSGASSDTSTGLSAEDKAFKEYLKVQESSRVGAMHHAEAAKSKAAANGKKRLAKYMTTNRGKARPTK